MNTAVTVPTATETQVVAEGHRDFLFIYNNSDSTIYLGGKGVTVNSGYPLVSGGEIQHVKTGADLSLFKHPIYAIHAAGSDKELRVWHGTKANR